VTKFLFWDSFGFLRRDEAGIELLLEQGVVARDLLHLLAPQPVEARVADVRDGDEVVVEEAYDRASSHPRALGVVLRGREDRAVGAADLLLRELLGQAHRLARPSLSTSLSCHVSCRPSAISEVAMPLATSPAL
jgi:hypothetical protein